MDLTRLDGEVDIGQRHHGRGFASLAGILAAEVGYLDCGHGRKLPVAMCPMPARTVTGDSSLKE
jgi:hypothetical protein